MHASVSQHEAKHVPKPIILCVCRRYTSVGLQYSYEQIPTAEALAAMLERSPITHAAQVRLKYKPSLYIVIHKLLTEQNHREQILQLFLKEIVVAWARVFYSMNSIQHLKQLTWSLF